MNIYVISLRRSTERRASIVQQFKSAGLNFEFFDAVDGRAVPPHPLFRNYNYLKRLWLTSGKMPSKGELGVYGSHYLLWQKCIESNEPIVVMEDDAVLQNSMPEYIGLISEKIKKYGFLRLEPKAYKGELHKKEVGLNYTISFMTANFDGLRCYAISPQAAKRLVDNSTRWCMPVDNYVGSIYLHKVPSYIFQPSVVENTESFETTIQLDEEKKAKWFRKPTRELYSLYRKLVMFVVNMKYSNEK
ncbi:glycosyltransferase family 25 protein [Vibrio tubiashii]|uniref:glycosyltransferase family 25 protein n=1 Tax=Vibrio tubiashii TaxID=29498 RepID=UPI001EFEC541|nr:glycosyltransferase family 25 protein [Vibrio tubiashii]MCG9584104.1 glycosyltransferase family 25 protein [Vibrio tubiashii]MCG9617699.1 glycosyltransferase family 25 protein [Vibrio tubiashii]MCG9690093.1 glycosyltransferase family 25 protein [Vibrio tubiashii]